MRMQGVRQETQDAAPLSLEVQLGSLLASWKPVLAAYAAVVGRRGGGLRRVGPAAPHVGAHALGLERGPHLERAAGASSMVLGLPQGFPTGSCWGTRLRRGGALHHRPGAHHGAAAGPAGHHRPQGRLPGAVRAGAGPAGGRPCRTGGHAPRASFPATCWRGWRRSTRRRSPPRSRSWPPSSSRRGGRGGEPHPGAGGPVAPAGTASA